jgi:cyclopropane-fatty-acyl-phospholipid synthase
MSHHKKTPWWQQPFKLEHGHLAYMADLWFYALAALGWTATLVVMAWAWPSSWQWGSFLSFLLGLMSWTLLEYGVHRLVFHGVEPFQRWHQAHHDRPSALIATPTVVGLTIFGVFVAWPMCHWTPIWMGSSWAGGVFTGSAIYAWVHHHIHQSRLRSAWMVRCKIRHALHHRPGRAVCYGVTVPFWDWVFNTSWDGFRNRSSTSG